MLLYRCGATLAIGKVPEELIDAIIAEGAGKGAVLHLLVAKDITVKMVINAIDLTRPG